MSDSTAQSGRQTEASSAQINQQVSNLADLVREFNLDTATSVSRDALRSPTEDKQDT